MFILGSGFCSLCLCKNIPVLCAEGLIVQTLCRHQGFVCAAFCYAAMIQNDDFIRILNGTDPVSDDDLGGVVQ